MPTTTKKRESVDILKPMTLTLKPEESSSGLTVFHATQDGRLVAVITVDDKAAEVYPEYHLPTWATRQLAQGALDMMRRAMDKPQ